MLVAALRNEASPKSGTKVGLATKARTLFVGLGCAARGSRPPRALTRQQQFRRTTLALCHYRCATMHSVTTTTRGETGGAPLRSVLCDSRAHHRAHVAMPMLDGVRLAMQRPVSTHLHQCTSTSETTIP